MCCLGVLCWEALSFEGPLLSEWPSLDDEADEAWLAGVDVCLADGAPPVADPDVFFVPVRVLFGFVAAPSASRVLGLAWASVLAVGDLVSSVLWAVLSALVVDGGAAESVSTVVVERWVGVV
ncbi:Uncharacterised protein [Mycobacteroides abscessus subsp. abscessus]|nr:Uncharacterised protein [Mycobacteroides abscessus subsp. abscessus]